jgi:hypothetical protein
MSGTTTNATTNYDTHIFTGKRSEFGMLKFADPHRQSTYGSHEIRYKKMLTLKMAYDKQEFLRKMRADIKREYLTRKKQLKKLQMDAAVVFRNAEYSLQEHYSSFATERRIDINAPLISQIQLPSGRLLDLKTFDQEREFGKVCQAHEDLRIDCEESAKYWEEQAQAQLRRDTEEKTSEILWNELVAERCLGCEDLECSDCYSYGYGYDNDNDNDNDNDGGDSGDSYDSGYFPCQYDYDREEREAREKWEALPPQQQEQLWEENTRDSDGETWDEEARADEAEYRREQFLLEELHAQMETGDDYPHVAQVTEPKERITVAAAGSTISAKTKAKSKTNAAAAARARIAKKQQNQFVPIQITVNTNRSNIGEEASSTLLYQGKAQINLPKKNLQNVSREAKKRNAEKWRRINTAEKQSNARGTRIANIGE